MKRIIFIVFLNLVSIACFSQSEVLIDLDSLSNAVYYEYDSGTVAGMIYQDTLEAANSTPDKLMSSIISASNQAWVNYNTLGGASNSDKKENAHFKELLSRDREKNFFELLSKLEFNYQNRKMAIIKFYLHLQDVDKGIAGSRVIEYDETDARWKIAQEPDLTSIATCIMIFKADVLKRLLTNNPANSAEESLIDYAYSSTGLNFILLLNRGYSNQEKDLLTNPLNW